MSSTSPVLAPLMAKHGFECDRVDNAKQGYDYCSKEVLKGDFVLGLALCVSTRPQERMSIDVTISSTDGLMLDNSYDLHPDSLAASVANRVLDEVILYVRDTLGVGGCRYLGWQPFFGIDPPSVVADAVAMLGKISTFVDSLPPTGSRETIAGPSHGSTP